MIFSPNNSGERYLFADDRSTKSIRMYTDIMWRVFHIFTEPVASVSVNRRNNEVRVHVAIWARANGYVKIWKTSHKISTDIRIFLQCRHETD